MSATQLRFNNRTTRQPGAVVKIDASLLDSPASGSTGRVLLIGNADGGVPYNAITDAEDVVSFRTADALRRGFRGGDLKEAGAMAFTPGRDTDITGAEEVIAIKVNPDTPASLTLSNASGPALTVTSRDYGPHTNQVFIEIGDTPAGGKTVTTSFEGVEEVKTGIGGTSLLTLQYTEPPAVGWDTMTAVITSGGITATGTRTEATRIAELLSSATNAVINVVSSSALDVGQVVTVYCLIAGVPSQIQLPLNGTTQVVSTALVDATSIFGATLSAAAVGTVLVRQAGNILSFTPADLDAGGVRGVGMFVQGGLSIVADGATTTDLMIVGRNASGAVVRERVVLNGTTPVPTLTINWRQIDFIGLTHVLVGRSVILTATAIATTHATQNTLAKVRDYFNGQQVTVSSVLYGFVATLGTTRTAYDPADLDVVASTNIRNPASGGFRADLALIAEYLTNESEFVTGAIASGAIGAPSNTTAPVYLAGGTLGVATPTDWALALSLAREVECDTVVCLTGDPSVHAELVAHVDYMAGPGRGERDAVIGVRNAAQTGLATYAEIRTQIAALNNRNIRVVAQEIDRFSVVSTTGERTTFPPHFLAAIVAGAQAGTALGRSLSHATLNVLAIRNHSSWNVVDQAEDALEDGLLFVETIKGVGRRICRDITSAVGSENIAFTDGAANRVINFVARDLRTDLDLFVGEPGFSGTRVAILGRARRKLFTYIDRLKILREFKNLDCIISSDEARVNVDIGPAFAINFIPITINLYDAPVTG